MQAVSIELGKTFEQRYNANDDQVLDLFSDNANFSLIVQQTPNSAEERSMNTFEAISLIYSEQIQ